MQNKWLFSCSTYRETLQKKIQLEGNWRGYKAALARSANCQPAYLSQVFSGRAQLTLEQAAGICDFWLLNGLETEFFLTLVEISRAGTPNLTKKLEQRLADLKERNETEEPKLQPPPTNPEKAINYYLDWSVSAVHISLTIPEFHESKSIAKKLGIEEARVLKALSVLRDLGIAEHKKTRWILTSKHLHASQETLFASLHHRNWRDKARDVISAEDSPKNLHYTSIYSLSREDFDKIRKMILEMIAIAHEVTKRSEEETLGCITLDWFEM